MSAEMTGAEKISRQRAGTTNAGAVELAGAEQEPGKTGRSQLDGFPPIIS